MPEESKVKSAATAEKRKVIVIIGDGGLVETIASTDPYIEVEILYDDGGEGSQEDAQRTLRIKEEAEQMHPVPDIYRV